MTNLSQLVFKAARLAGPVLLLLLAVPAAADDVQVNTTTAGTQSRPSVAADRTANASRTRGSRNRHCRRVQSTAYASTRCSLG